MRVLLSLWPRIRKIFSRGYSQTRYLGELFEAKLFSKIQDGEQDKPRYLQDLYIKPKGEIDNFAPKNQNWRRQAKVPILILNATTLNTGHNWQFTASWMGESPGTINSEIDANDVLRRMYYDEAPVTHRRVRLGHAVAASACVPALFEPLVLADLYPKRTVRLVDGGVHDNQGVAGLLEQDCTVLLVSDASGQAASELDPKRRVLGVLSRSNNILMARVRDAEYREVDARRRSSLLRGLMFVHLKKDLVAEHVDWIGCEDPYGPQEGRPLTRYGIRKDVQASLAAIRTDLDSFSDMEAYALATSGYRMTEHELALDESPAAKSQLTKWKFLSIEEPMTRVQGVDAEHARLMKLLKVAGERALKPWKLSFWTFLFFNLGTLLLFSLVEHRLFKFVDTLNLTRGISYVVLSVATLLIVWLALKTYLVFYNRIYLAEGKIRSVPVESEARSEAAKPRAIKAT
jgi:predicted acylesterase/phospholipase RssA